MLPGTGATAYPALMLRGTRTGPLGDITDAQRAEDAAARSAALEYAMSDLKDRRAAEAKAQADAQARQAEAEAAARWERTQQTALQAASEAATAAGVAQGAILQTSKGSLTKVLVTLVVALGASYLLFAKTYRRGAPAGPRQNPDPWGECPRCHTFVEGNKDGTICGQCRAESAS